MVSQVRGTCQHLSSLWDDHMPMNVLCPSQPQRLSHSLGHGLIRCPKPEGDLERGWQPADLEVEHVSPSADHASPSCGGS